MIPELLSAKGARRPVRVWSAGCATGEEAYTLAMVLAEAMGADEFRERVKIYATDVDEDALAAGARRRHTEARRWPTCPRSCWQKYFEAAGPGYAFRSDLRRAVIFGRHDLIQDAPISRVDLLVVPQHADVLQRRDPGQHRATGSTSRLPTRASCSWARPRCC